MTLTQLYDPTKGVMNIAGFMSGSGTNLKKIIETEQFLQFKKVRSSYHVAVIFTDNAESNASKLGRDYNIPVIMHDIKAFYKSRDKPLKDLDVRKEFDMETAKALSVYNISVGAFAGYMSIVTAPLIDSLLCVNVHPADLTIMDGAKRKYTGAHAVRDAILAGEKQLRSTTHILEERVDYGTILMVSKPLQVRLPAGFDKNDKNLVDKVAAMHQNILKEEGDWVIFPKTLRYLANGKYSKDEMGNLYFDDLPIINGVRLD